MSARDSASGSSTYKGGSGGAGGLGNGGVGGGMGGGYRGGGAGYNGGAGSRTGLTTGTTTYGNTAFGRPGGNAVAYGMRDAASLGRAGMGPTVGSFGNFRTPSGAAMFGNSSVQGQSFYGRNMGQALSQANRAQARQPKASASVPGLLGGSPVAAGAPAGIPMAPQYPAYEAEMALPEYPPVTEIDIPFPEQQPTGLPVGFNMLQRAIGAPFKGFRAVMPGGDFKYKPEAGFANSIYGNPGLGTPTPGGVAGKYGIR